MDCKQDCQNYLAKPAPAEKSVEERLRDAGATVEVVAGTAHSLGNTLAFLYSNAVDLRIDRLTPDRAVAALEAARGLKYQDATAELATANTRAEWSNTEIIRLREAIDYWQCQHLNMSDRRVETERQRNVRDTEIKRLKDKFWLQETYLAEAVYHVKSIEWLYHADEDSTGYFCPECGESRDDGHGDNCKMGAWLARNKENQ